MTKISAERIAAIDGCRAIRDVINRRWSRINIGEERRDNGNRGGEQAEWRKCR